MTAAARTAPPVLVCGEVRTGLLPHSGALPAGAAVKLLAFRADEPVRLTRRPCVHAVSPGELTGVDCRLPTATGARIRATGTVAARAVLTGGRMLQATAYAALPAAGPDQRRPWAHYLARPSVLEPYGKLPERDVADGLLTAAVQPGELDLGSVAERLLARVSRDRALDQRAPFTSRRTRLCWVALRALDDEGPGLVSFTLAGNGLRTAELRLPHATEPAAVAAACEDLARHDWLLTTVTRMVERAAAGPDTVAALRPAVDHLLHLWMPAAHTDPALAPLWAALERAPGFTRQWQVLAQRIRDQLALRAAFPQRRAGPARDTD